MVAIVLLVVAIVCQQGAHPLLGVGAREKTVVGQGGAPTVIVRGERGGFAETGASASPTGPPRDWAAENLRKLPHRLQTLVRCCFRGWNNKVAVFIFIH